MSARREFSRKTRALAFERCNGSCESCGARLKVGEGEYDHILPDVFSGEPTIENCQVLCRACHKAKTRIDNLAAKKSTRVRDKASGAFRSKRGFRKLGSDKFKPKIGGGVVWRDTGKPVTRTSFR
jgi:5-methylcytosine-specific restriction endonuclease McrA